VRASSCFFNSISELGPLLTCALAFVPVERSLRPRVGFFAPLRDNVTSSAQSLVPFRSGPPKDRASILTEPQAELASFASTADLGGAFSIGRGHDAFEAELAVPLPYHLSHIVPVHGWVKHLREITADRERATAHVNVFVELGQPEPLVSGIVDSPRGWRWRLRWPRRRRLRWLWRQHGATLSGSRRSTFVTGRMLSHSD